MGTQSTGQMFHFQLSEGLDSCYMGPFEKTRHSQLGLGSELNRNCSDVKRLNAPIDEGRQITFSDGIFGWQQKNEAELFEPSDFLVLEDESEVLSKGENEEKLTAKTETAVGQSRGAFSFRSSESCVEEHQSQKSTVINNNNKSPETARVLKKNIQKRKSERAVRYAFRTRSDSDILEDGYKWRKYGKKFVKNSPNPRNYYRCSDCNCDVKKRVERDPRDAGVVITTYEGKHNHESPSVIYYIGKPIVLPQNAPTDQFSQFCQTKFMFL